MSFTAAGQQGGRPGALMWSIIIAGFEIHEVERSVTLINIEDQNMKISSFNFDTNMEKVTAGTTERRYGGLQETPGVTCFHVEPANHFF